MTSRVRRVSGIDLILVPPRVEASLWRRLRFQGEVRCREALFNRYRGLAKSVAGRQLSLRDSRRVDRGDLEQFAYEGLLEAIDRFDPLRGIPFGAYARRRIAGCISTGAARLNEVDAQISQRRRIETDRLRSLSRATDETPSGALAELAMLAAELAVGVMLEGTALIVASGKADHRPNAYESLAWRELQMLLDEGVARLGEREQIIIRQHYRHGVSFTQIATLLGITKGRVSQLHKAALASLRRKLV